MKATGIVRRIDDLGRVVIPKEIRRTMRIREAPRHSDIIAPRYQILVLNHGHFRKNWSGSRGLLHHAKGRKASPIDRSPSQLRRRFCMHQKANFAPL